VDQIFYGEAHPFQGEFIRCQSDHGDYACSRGGVAKSGGDGTDCSTQMPICQAHVDAYGYVLSCQTLNAAAFQYRAPGALTRYWRTPGCVPSRGLRIRKTGLTGGEILPARGYSDGGKGLVRITPSFSSVLGWWSLLFSQEWWDHIQYGVHGSPTIFHWRELGHIQNFMS
jgi:hypothetical protein